MRRLVLVAVLAAVLSILTGRLAFAQDGGKPASGNGSAEKGSTSSAAPALSSDSTAAPAPTPAPVEPVSGEKVKVRLKTGVVLSGVVMGPHAEVLRGNHFVPAKGKDVPGAGIRLHYAMGLNGFLFVPYDSMKSCRFEGKLTEAEGVSIAKDLEVNRRKAKEDRARAVAEIQAQKEAASQSSEGKTEKGTSAESEKAPRAEARRAKSRKHHSADEGDQAKARDLKIRKLLKRFPPDKWTPSRLNEIKKRAIILDILPNKEERAFLDNYDLWFEGYQVWKRAHADRKGEKAEHQAKEQAPASK